MMSNKKWGGLIVLFAMATGCGMESQQPAAEPDSEDLGQSIGELKSEYQTAVRWIHRELIGRSVESEDKVDGKLSISLRGEPLTISNSRYASQAAVVTTLQPQFKNPSVLVKRRYYVRYLVKPNGSSTSFAAQPWAPVVIIDASIHNAAARFRATYDPETQRVQETFLFANGISHVNFDFVANDTSITPDYNLFAGGILEVSNHVQRSFTVGAR